MPINRSVEERKKGGSSFSNFSINKEPSASKKGRREEKKERKKADTEKESKYTNSKDIERTKKRGTNKESNKKQRRNTQHRFVYGISSVPLSLSLSQIIIFVW